MIKNEPVKYVGDKFVDAIRTAYENRGNWYYFLVKEGLDRGLELEFARDALREAGEFLGGTRFKNCKSMQDFADIFMTLGVKKANEGEIRKLTDTELQVELGYCPLVAAWLKLTDDEEYLAQICDVCMDMDRSLAKTKGMDMELKSSIAKGDGKCTLCFSKKQSAA
jgi:hypothetical protein